MKSSDIQNPQEAWAKKRERGDKLRATSLDWTATKIKDVAEYNRTHDPFSQLRRAFGRRKSRDGQSVAFDAAHRQRLHRALDAILDKHKSCESYSLAAALNAITFPSDSRRVSTRRSYQMDSGKCGSACEIKGKRIPKMAFSNPFDPHRQLSPEARFRIALKNASSVAEIEQILTEASERFA